MSERTRRNQARMRKLIVLYAFIALIVIIFIIFFLSKTMSSKESAREEGIKQFRNGNYEQAISAFQRSLAEEQWFSSEMDLDTRMYLATAFLRTERFRDASDCYKKLLEENDGTLNNELILSMQETADARAVIKEGGSGIPSDETIERLKKLSGEQPYLYLQLASAYVRKGDAAAAREALQSYLSVRPLNTYVAAELSTAYLKEGKTAEAKEMIEKGLACEDGTYVELLEYNSLVAAEADGDYEASFAKAEELHQRYPENESITKEYTFLYTRTHPNTEPVNPNNDALEDNSGY